MSDDLSRAKNARLAEWLRERAEQKARAARPEVLRVSLEDALIATEARLAEAHRDRATHAAEIEAETAQREKLQARLDALPQHERRQVLDAAGLRHVSAAPEPIKPLRGTGDRTVTRSVATKAPEQINWKLWLNMPQVALWEGVALVQGIEPHGLRPLREGWMAGPGRGPFFEPRSFSTPGERKAFDDALLLADRAANHDGPPIHVRRLSANKRTAMVSLAEVVAYFVGCNWEGIPEPLLELASRAAEQSVESTEQRQDRCLKDCEDEGLRMPASHLGRLPDGVGKMAEAEGVTRQTYSDGLKAALKRREAVKRDGNA